LKAAVYYGPGDIRIEDAPMPDFVGPEDVLIAVSKAAICGSDSSEWDHGPVLTVPPVILGHEFMGVVVEVGSRVTSLQVGDRVVSGAGISCGTCEWCVAGRTNLCEKYYTLGLQVNGGLAEYVTSPASICWKIPDNVDDVAAALIQPFAVALHGLRRAKVRRGASVAIIGVGGIGGFLIAGAVARGADPVIAIDVDSQRLHGAGDLGATHLIDAKNEDATSRVLEFTGALGAHTVIEATGVKGSPQQALDMVRRGGDVLILGLHTGVSEVNLIQFTLREIDLHGTLAHVCAEDIPEALEILSTSGVASQVLDRVISLDELVEQGIIPLAERRAKGKIVVDVLR
jgi:threonine dehydrogenase-like Zn-dependent dehydrogenase